jgi:hypothetical protein
MRDSWRFVVLMGAIVIFGLGTAFAAERMVVGEMYTNTG